MASPALPATGSQVQGPPLEADRATEGNRGLAGGGYRSAQNYFDAAVTYQKKILRPLLRKAVRPFTRAVFGGIPGARLKARFPVDCLAPLVLPTRGKAWNPWTTAHATDALLLAVGGMRAAAQDGHRRRS